MERLSVAEYQARAGANRKPHKFGAFAAWRCDDCGAGAPGKGSCHACGTPLVRFDSRAEARRWDHLRQQERLG